MVVKKNKKNRRRRDVNRRSISDDLNNLPPAPIFDSETGGKQVGLNLKIEFESSEQSIFLMQRLRIGQSECLTFFDSGANAHLVETTLAVNENLQQFSYCKAEIGVVCGGTIANESGSFRFNLCSGQKGTCHEIRAIGMSEVTAEIPNYSLDDIGKEFMSTSTDQEKDYILPKTVGGSKAHLLLGVKNTRIKPILLRVLPLGLGVYLSQFTDIWGSRIIFAGP